MATKPMRSPSHSPTDPFSDAHEATDLNSSNALMFPTDFMVPIIDSIQSPPKSSVSTTSTTWSRSTEPSEPPSPYEDPIQWTNVNLNDLLSILYPSLIMTNSLIFSPPLEDLETQQAPLTLSLYVKGPTSPVPAEAYNKDLPIGTGRPTSRHLLAATPLSASPQLARQFLAVALLDDWNMINRIYAEYNFLSSVYSAPNDELASLQRGMRTMLQVDDAELLSRYYQMREVGIGERDELGCRVEMFMLEADGEERGQWMESVDVGIGMGEEKRREWARNYADAGRFLRRAMLGY